MNKLFALLLIIVISQSLVAQNLRFEKVALSDSVDLSIKMQNLAQDYLLKSKEYGRKTDPKDLSELKYWLKILNLQSKQFSL